MEKRVRLTESELQNIIGNSVKKIISELKWQTYANAAKKGDEWRKAHPVHRANKWNRVHDFDNAAMKEFDKKYNPDGDNDLKKGKINLFLNNGNDVEVSGLRDHDFHDENPHGLNHNFYYLNKKYGKNGNYGRTRMWDFSHDTTPEDFYDDEEMGKRFRDAEKEVEDFKNNRFNESVEQPISNDQNYSHFAVNKATNKIVNGWDYNNIDSNELKQFKKDYFFNDLADYGLNPKDYKIVGRNYLLRQGIDPSDNANWANN